MKHVLSNMKWMGLFTLLSLGASVYAQDSTTCPSVYAMLFAHLAQNTKDLKTLEIDRVNSVIAYDRSGSGRGPGQINQGYFLDDLVRRRDQELKQIEKLRQIDEKLLTQYTECFPGLSVQNFVDLVQQFQ